MRDPISFAVVAAALLFSATASAADPAAMPDTNVSGPEFGLRTGYSLPLGRVQGDQTVTVAGTPTTVTGQALSDSVSGRLPIWVDAGYRISRSFYVGAFFQYGLMFVNKDKNPECNQSTAGCAAHDLVFGVDAHFHIMPEAAFDPWVGLGIGYEIVGTSETVANQSVNRSIAGFQFLNLQLGGDYKVTPQFGVGPFVAFSLGQYTSASVTQGTTTSSQDPKNTAMHEWLTIGVRGTYGIW